MGQKFSSCYSQSPVLMDFITPPPPPPPSKSSLKLVCNVIMYTEAFMNSASVHPLCHTLTVLRSQAHQKMVDNPFWADVFENKNYPFQIKIWSKMLQIKVAKDKTYRTFFCLGWYWTIVHFAYEDSRINLAPWKTFHLPPPPPPPPPPQGGGRVGHMNYSDPP